MTLKCSIYKLTKLQQGFINHLLKKDDEIRFLKPTSGSKCSEDHQTAEITRRIDLCGHYLKTKSTFPS